MNNRTKVILGAIVALFAISLVFRFVVLSQVGVAGGWIFYLGLPIGGIIALLVLLLRAAEAAQLRRKPKRHGSALAAQHCRAGACAGVPAAGGVATLGRARDPAHEPHHFGYRIRRRARTDHLWHLIHNVAAAQPISDTLGISSSPKRCTNPAGSGLPGTGPMLIMSMPSSAYSSSRFR